MIKLFSQGKFIDTCEIAHLFTQGEKCSDIVHIVIDSVNNDVDISECTFTMRTLSAEDSMTETVLIKSHEADKILLSWKIPAAASAVAGPLRLELVGTKGDAVVVKFRMPPVFVRETLMGRNIPVPDVVEEKLSEMNRLIDGILNGTGQSDGGALEIAASRKSFFNNQNHDSLSERLYADFSECVTTAMFWVMLNSETDKLRNEWRSDINSAFGSAMYSLSELVDLPEEEHGGEAL